MNSNSKIAVIALCILLVVADLLCKGGKEINWKKMITNQRNELLRSSKTASGVVQVQMLPAAAVYPGNAETQSVYVVRIKLKTSAFLHNGPLMQYMNFGIGKNFFAMQGNVSLQQLLCVKIPGIDQNEFTYMTCFKKILSRTGDSLSLNITDTIAGFGTQRFGFSGQALQKLEQ